MEIRWVEEQTQQFVSYEAFQLCHPNALVLAVDGKESIGNCESCGVPIVQGDKYQQWEDAITCETCSEGSEKLFTA